MHTFEKQNWCYKKVIFCAATYTVYVPEEAKWLAVDKDGTVIISTHKLVTDKQCSEWQAPTFTSKLQIIGHIKNMSVVIPSHLKWTDTHRKLIQS